MHLLELMPATPGRNLELFMKLLENKLYEINLENPIKDFEIEIVPCPEKIQQLDFWEPRVSDKDKLEKLVSIFNQASLTTGFLKPQDEILPDRSWTLSDEFEEAIPIEDHIDVCGTSLQIKPSYSRSQHSAPRPSRLLKKPRRLFEKDVGRLQFLSSHPVERLEDSWWESSRGRDYFFALSPQGQFLWIFYDRIENEYFLHGYFD
jgi:protein ImuB